MKEIVVINGTKCIEINNNTFYTEDNTLISARDGNITVLASDVTIPELDNVLNPPRAWIARDKDNGLWIYNKKPVHLHDSFGLEEDYGGDSILNIPSAMYPEVTYENSPRLLVVK